MLGDDSPLEVLVSCVGTDDQIYRKCLVMLLKFLAVILLSMTLGVSIARSFEFTPHFIEFIEKLL